MWHSSAWALLPHLCLFPKMLLPSGRKAQCQSLSLFKPFFLLFKHELAVSIIPFNNIYSFRVACIDFFWVWSQTNQKQVGDLDAQYGQQICVRHSKGSQNHGREKRKQQFQLLPNHHNLDFSCKAQKYTNAVIFVTSNPAFQGCYKRWFKLLETENLEPILPLLRKWVILLFSPPVHPAASSPFSSLCPCLTPCFTPQKAQPPSFLLSSPPSDVS